MVQSWVLSVRKTERAVACFKKMVENKVNAVCVVDVVGKFDAQLSSSSLRVLKFIYILFSPSNINIYLLCFFFLLLLIGSYS